MISTCIDRIKQDNCDAWARRDACADLFRGLFTSGERSARPNPFLAFLGQVAKAMEARAAARAPEPSPLQRDIERQVEPLLDGGEVRMDQVARALGMSRQTLYRRLKDEGVTFEAILDRLRHRLALDLIRKQRLSVKEAAYRLGFSDPAAFSRAFKRWTGASPAAMRGQRPWSEPRPAS